MATCKSAILSLGAITLFGASLALAQTNAPPHSSTGASPQTGTAPSGQPIVYPKKGQSQAQQQKDIAECAQWATKQTGVDPVAIAQQATQGAPSGSTTGGEAVRGAGKGAAVGAIGGAIGGDAGKGAAIGAGVGGAAGVAKKRQGGREVAEQQQQAQQEVQAKMASFNKAQSACLEGRNYTVK